MDWKPYTKITAFPWWAHKVLPLVYDESLSYYEVLCKVMDYLNKLITDVSNVETNVDELKAAYEELKDYVDNYFDNLDIQTEINNKMDTWLNSGLIADIINAGTNPLMDPLCNIENNTGKIGCIGDSVTYGYSVSTQAQNQYPYPELLEDIIQHFYDNVTVYNYGETGYTSARWLTQYTQALANDCDIIIFMFGHNDFRLNLGLDHLLDNITEFITQCLTDEKTPVVCSVPPYYGTDTYRYNNGDIIAEQIKRVTYKYGGVYCPVYETMKTMFESGTINIISLLPDGVHFENYRLLANIIASKVFTQTTEIPQGNIITAWRCNGLIFSNASIYTGLSNNGRIINLKPDSEYEVSFFSDKPFKLSTITTDYQESGTVTWAIVKDGTPSYFVHNYIRSQQTASNEQTVTQITSHLFEPGRYTLRLADMDINDGHSLAVLYLCGILIEPVDYLLLNPAS